MCESTGPSAEVSEAALCWGGCFQGFHFEAKMDACAHFFLLPLWPHPGSYIILMNSGAAAGPCEADVRDNAYAVGRETSSTHRVDIKTEIKFMVPEVP